MQLRPITFHASSSTKGQPFSQSYKIKVGHTLHEIEERFLRLVEHLEQHVEAPQQWICTSHYDLHFFDQDLERFAGFGDTPHWTLAIQARPVGFTISTHAHPPWISDAGRIENPETIEEAAAIISDILEKRGNWVEMRWMREQYQLARQSTNQSKLTLKQTSDTGAQSTIEAGKDAEWEDHKNRD